MATKKTALFPIDMDGAYHAPLGEIARRWAWIEFQLGVVLREGYWIKKPTGRALTIGMELNVLISTCKTLVENDYWIPDKSLRDEIWALAKEIQDKAKTRRHNYVHGVYGYYKDDPWKVVRHSFKPSAHRVEIGHEPVTPESLQQVAGEARDLQIRLQLLTKKIKKWKETARPPQ